jgi:hypothetical protein
MEIEGKCGHCLPHPVTVRLDSETSADQVRRNRGSEEQRSEDGNHKME